MSKWKESKMANIAMTCLLENMSNIMLRKLEKNVFSAIPKTMSKHTSIPMS
jgi:hypothetical protein